MRKENMLQRPDTLVPELSMKASMKPKSSESIFHFDY